jgi:hypothetical protein
MKKQVAVQRLSRRSVDYPSTRVSLPEGGLTHFNKFIIGWTIAMVALKASNTLLILTLGTAI